MEPSNWEADLRPHLPSDELKTLVSSSSRHVPTSNKGSDACKKPGASSTSHIPSHYYELHQLNPEEDLIRLDSRPPTLYTQPNRLDILVRSPSNVESSREQPRQ